MSAFTFLTPSRLWLLALVPLLLVGYLVVQRRRRRVDVVRFPNLALLRSVAPTRAAWRRHVTAGALLLAIASLLFGFARPAVAEEVPREEATVILAIDVSGSMLATDVAPTRLQAAVAAATDFVNDVPDDFHVGLVSFDDAAHVLAAPTTDRAVVTGALQGLQRGPGTAAGEGVAAALDLVPEEAEATRIVLLADGASTVGLSLDDAAAAAADAGVPVDAIAYGTDEGRAVVNGELVPVPADPESMQSVAEATGGTFFEAASGEELRAVYEDIGRRITYRVEQHELTLVAAGVGLSLLAAATAGALLWSNRLV